MSPCACQPACTNRYSPISARYTWIPPAAASRSSTRLRRCAALRVGCRCLASGPWNAAAATPLRFHAKADDQQPDVPATATLSSGEAGAARASVGIAAPVSPTGAAVDSPARPSWVDKPATSDFCFVVIVVPAPARGDRTDPRLPDVAAEDDSRGLPAVSRAAASRGLRRFRPAPATERQGSARRRRSTARTPDSTIPQACRGARTSHSPVFGHDQQV